MENKVKFKIDNRECTAEAGMNLVEAAKENNVYIPALCHLENADPAGSCRICTVMINGKAATACTIKVVEGMNVENNTPEIQELRKVIVELLFAEGNHLCPSCEKSGSCDLQGLAYRYGMMVPRFPYEFPKREIDADNEKILIDHNRCILCKRCVREIKNNKGKSVFAFFKRGHKVKINIDEKSSKDIDDSLAKHAMEICPVGAIIKKGIGFTTPIGKRKYDNLPIGSDIEK